MPASPDPDDAGMPVTPTLMDILSIVGTVTTPPALHTLLSHHESGHYRAMPSFVTTRPRPADHLIIWLVRGELDATIGPVDVKAGPGDLLVLEPHVPQRYEPDRDVDWEWLWVHYGGTAARDLSGRICGRSGPVVRFGFDEHIRARFLELVAIASASRPTGDNLCLDSCLYSLLGLIADRAGSLTAGRARTSGSLPDIHELINERLAGPLTLRDLVTFTGYSATHLNRLFHDQTGESPIRYVHNLRMARAASLLTVSTLSVAEVACAVGFPDPYHFSRRFKQSTGYAPAHYRAANRRAGS